MKVLIACEFSQVVTEAFTKEGHEVLSCDFFSGEKGRGSLDTEKQKQPVCG